MASIITETTLAVMNPLASIWQSIVDLAPSLLGALIVSILGYFIGLLVGVVVHKLLDKAGFDKAMKKFNIGKHLGGHSISEIIGGVLKWYIFVVFLGSAVELIKLRPLAALLDTFVRWLPNFVLGFVFMVIGLIGAEFIYDRITHAKNIKGVQSTALAVKIMIIIFAALVSLELIGVHITLAKEAFLIVLGSLGLGFAIALGIGFGEAMKQESKAWMKALKKL